MIEAGCNRRQHPLVARTTLATETLMLRYRSLASVELLRAETRAVAQFGSALHWGCRGRRFKSCQPDHMQWRIMGRDKVMSSHEALFGRAVG